MKQVRPIILVFLFSAMLAFTSCATFQQEAEGQIPLPPLESTVAAIDKYGNLTLQMGKEELLGFGYEVGDITEITVGSLSFEAPIGTSYSDVDKGNLLVRLNQGSVMLAINYGDLGKASSAVVGSPVLITLSRKGGYLQQFELRRLVRSENREDYASDEVFANFRMVQNGSIAANTLYRSANPLLDDPRAPYVEALAREAGIRTVINLADEQTGLYANLGQAPYYKALAEEGSVIALNMGVTCTDPDFTAKLREGLAFMASHKGPYLVHCNEGKDRAGFVIALLSALMGATVDEVVEDYMKSYQNYYGLEKGSERYVLISKIILDLFADLNGGKAVTNRSLGSVARAYLTDQVELSPGQIRAIQDNLSARKLEIHGSIVFTL